MNTLIKKELKESEYNQIYKILSKCDQDFVPPLSTRCSCDTMVFEKNQSENSNIKQYFDSIFLIPRIFFMEYVKNENQFHSFAVTTPKWSSYELYINIFCVESNYRHMGLGKNLIFEVISYAKLHNYNKIMTRTWSTNHNQLSLLKKFNFKEKICTAEVRKKDVYSVYCEYTIR